MSSLLKKKSIVINKTFISFSLNRVKEVLYNIISDNNNNNLVIIINLTLFIAI